MELLICEVDRGGAARVTNTQWAGPLDGVGRRRRVGINVLTKMAKWEYDLAEKCWLVNENRCSVSNVK